MSTNCKSRYRNHATAAEKARGLKTWARRQAADKTSHAEACQSWLRRKGLA